MPEIGRRNYNIAVARLFENSGLVHDALALCKFLIRLKGKPLLLDFAGKNLPYFGSRHDEAFVWETHLKKARVQRLRTDASRKNAEPWVAFCYAILDDRFARHFRSIVAVNGIKFGMNSLKLLNLRSSPNPDRHPGMSLTCHGTKY